MEKGSCPGAENVHALVRKINDGDKDAFQMIIRIYQQKVFIMAYSILRNKEDALDIVQETFLRLYQKMHLFKEGRNFQAWLLQITKNLCVDHYRKNVKKRREFESPQSFEILEAAAAPDPAFTAAADSKDAFALGIERLASRQRMVFVLKHVNELQYNEISETMNISLGTVKSLHFKAVRNLRKWLGPSLGRTS